MADEPAPTNNTPPPAPPPAAPPAEPPKAEPSVLGGEPSKPTDKPADKPADKPEDKPADKVKDGDKPADKPAPVDPKAFKLPEGFTVDEAQMGQFATLTNEFGLTQENAQKLVDLHANALKQASEASSKFWADKQTEWLIEAKKTYGPEPAKNPKIIAVSKAIDSLGEKPAAALREALEMSGMGNHPAFVAAFVSFAERLTEPAHAKGAPANRPANIAESFYGNTMNKG